MLEPELQLSVFIKATFWNVVMVAVLTMTRILRHMHVWADNLSYDVAVKIYGEPECDCDMVFRKCISPGCGEISPENECDNIEPEVYLCPYCHDETEVCVDD